MNKTSQPKIFNGGLTSGIVFLICFMFIVVLPFVLYIVRNSRLTRYSFMQSSWDSVHLRGRKNRGPRVSEMPSAALKERIKITMRDSRTERTQRVQFLPRRLLWTLKSLRQRMHLLSLGRLSNRSLRMHQMEFQQMRSHQCCRRFQRTRPMYQGCTSYLLKTPRMVSKIILHLIF